MDTLIDTLSTFSLTSLSLARALSLSRSLSLSLSRSLSLLMCTAGIATGTAIAGMLGELQPRFSLQGQAMHLAAELETNVSASAPAPNLCLCLWGCLIVMIVFHSGLHLRANHVWVCMRLCLCLCLRWRLRLHLCVRLRLRLCTCGGHVYICVQGKTGAVHCSADFVNTVSKCEQGVKALATWHNDRSPLMVLPSAPWPITHVLGHTCTVTCALALSSCPASSACLCVFKKVLMFTYIFRVHVMTHSYTHVRAPQHNIHTKTRTNTHKL